MNDYPRNACASYGLEILKACVLDVLPDIHVSGQLSGLRLVRKFQGDICARLGIPYLSPDKSKYDNLIYGILVRLREEKHVSFKSETPAVYQVKHSDQKMKDNTRNRCASYGLEILKQCVLDVLYDIHVSGLRLSRKFQGDICARLGIPYVSGKVLNDHLIHGILIRLREEKYASYKGHVDAPADQVDKWQITEKGIKIIQGN